MFRMDSIVKDLVEHEYQKAAPRCPHLTRPEIETVVLGQLEADGKVMRYLRRNGKGIAWKATPRMRRTGEDYEADLLADAEDDNDH